MPTDPYQSSIYRVTFLVMSKEGDAKLRVSHPAARQTLELWLYPSNTVPESLPYLEEVFAHYVAQWPKIMVEDISSKDSRGFYLEANQVPPRIADPTAADPLTEIAFRSMPPGWATPMRQQSGKVLLSWSEPFFNESWEPYTSAPERGIIPYPNGRQES